MASEFDELIWRVLDGTASPEEISRVMVWMRDSEHRKYLKKMRKIWNLVSGPHVSPERKRVELERFGILCGGILRRRRKDLSGKDGIDMLPFF